MDIERQITYDITYRENLSIEVHDLIYQTDRLDNSANKLMVTKHKRQRKELGGFD